MSYFFSSYFEAFLLLCVLRECGAKLSLRWENQMNLDIEQHLLLHILASSSDLFAFYGCSLALFNNFVVREFVLFPPPFTVVCSI